MNHRNIRTTMLHFNILIQKLKEALTRPFSFKYIKLIAQMNQNCEKLKVLDIYF